MTELIVTKPGVYDDMPEARYHADPVPEGSLSCSGAKLLLPPGCPAKFDYARKNGRTSATRAMEFGSAAHAEVLGAGWPVAVWDGPDWRPKAAQDFGDAARARGEIPITSPDREKIAAMRAAIEAHPTVRQLLRGDARPEMSVFWQDGEFGIWRRSRMDAIDLRGRVYIVDYKTARSADPEEFARAAARYGYHWQHPFYCDGITATLGDAEPAFLFIVQDKDPPYLVGIYELDAEAVMAGREQVRRACRLFARCQAAGEWPGYQQPGEIVTRIRLPRWAL